MSESRQLVEVIVKHPVDAFVSRERIDAEWRALDFVQPPRLPESLREFDAFVGLLAEAGAHVRSLPRADGVGLDSIYTRDASIATPRGMVICRMGKRLREGEPAAQADAFRAWGIPVVGEITPPGRLEGGDVAWLSPRVVAVGQGYRTNAAGIAQFTALLQDEVDDVITVPLVHWRGPSDVFHLMSIISPVDDDLAVVYSPLLPVSFRERLLALGYSLVEVPDDEFASLGTNVLAIAPRRCVMLEGNPITRARLEAAGADVRVYDGWEISLKGGGGPTCLTRPISRRAE